MQYKTAQLEKELYSIVDSFLVEAKDQNGKERSVERLNQDRHLAVDNLLNLFKQDREAIRKWTKKHISYVDKEYLLSFLDGLEGE